MPDKTRIIKLNEENIFFQSQNNYKFGVDSLLLYKHICNISAHSVLEFGCGDGIISVLYSLKKILTAKITAIDICNQYIENFKRTIAYNNIQNIELICGDLFEYSIKCKQKFDLIFFNPPYYNLREGKINLSSVSLAAKHQVLCVEDDFLIAAKRLLLLSGVFCFIYPAFKINKVLENKIFNIGWDQFCCCDTGHKKFKIIELRNI